MANLWVVVDFHLDSLSLLRDAGKGKTESTDYLCLGLHGQEEGWGSLRPLALYATGEFSPEEGRKQAKVALFLFAVVKLRYTHFCIIHSFSHPTIKKHLVSTLTQYSARFGNTVVRKTDTIDRHHLYPLINLHFKEVTVGHITMQIPKCHSERH